MSISCPYCETDSVQSLAMAYQSGLSHVSSKSKGTGAGTSGGHALVFSQDSASSGISQTALSQRAAPPEKRSYLAIILLCAGLYLALGISGLLVSIFSETIGSWMKTGGLICLLSMPVPLFFAFRFSGTQYPALLTQWNRTFICLKCGGEFTP